ncbi:glycerophosphoryl diester phosphodiesterase membrane domain-containing protein [Streptomyces sp. NPDC050264]|uniref:glycerophosphoryl diester phosphodiesterase membrane domain-containing protein n=1 Tax=Streptomyces sp. NPDC050264 TaxID=3155038 RepID=UPI003441A78A
MNDTPGWASPGSAPSDGPDGNRQDDGGGDAQGAGPQDTAGQGPQWSKEQPPPAQWSAPSGSPNSDSGQTPPPPPPPPGQGGQGWGGQGWGNQPPGGPGGYGSPGGWGPGAWGSGPPPAAKPGVIPLRPLGVGEILDGAVSTMRTYWRTVLGISLTVAVITEVLVVLLQGFVLDDSTTDALDDPSASAGEVTRAMGGILIGSGVVQVVTLLGTIVATALLTTVTSRAVLGRSVTIGEAWRDARPQLLRLLGLTLLLPLIAAAIVFVGTIPGILVAVLGSSNGGLALAVIGGLAGLVVAIWLMIRFSLASPALMLEKQTIRKAMSRSTKLVRGAWWRVFGIQILASIIAGVVASIILVPFSLIAGTVSGDGLGSFLDSSGDVGWTFLIISGIGAVVGSTITFPITAGVTVLLYIDQRIRREALDIELAGAAGLQGYGGTPGATPGS